MERLLEMELVRQCAPTLAGLKAASLFRFVFPPLVSPLCFDQPDCHTAGEKEPFSRNAEL